MPILASSMYVNAYGKSAVVAVTGAAPLDSMGGTLDTFVVKYNTSGKSIWSARISSTQPDVGFGITTDTGGNVYVSGRGGNATVTAFNADGSPFFPLLANDAAGDAFIVKYNTNGVVQWTARIGSVGADDVAFAIATDSSANVYITGQAAAGTVYNANGTAFATALANSGGYDTFVVKYNTNGAVQWVARIASTGSEYGYAIATDSGGNVYITGAGGSGVTMSAFSSNGVAFGTTLGTSGGVDAFIVKYNTSGIVQWVARVGSTGTDIGYGIATDSSGNVYITGSNGGATTTVINADGTSFSPTLASSGGEDAFIVKYNTNGAAQWVAKVAAAGADYGYAIATDSSGNVYVTGQGGNTVVSAFNSDGTSFATTNPNAGGGDLFIAKYNTNGFVQWLTRIATNAADAGFGIAADTSGNVYVTGRIPGNRLGVTAYNFNGTTFASILGSLAGSGEVFVAKYNTSGVGQWFAYLSSSGDDSGRALAIDSAGNSYTTGQFNGNRLTVYGQALSLFSTIPNAGGTDAFVVKYNTNGSPQWVARVASTASDAGYGITYDAAGNVYVTGEGGTGAVITAYNADTTAFATTIANAGLTDTFVVKYNGSGVVQWVTRVAGTGNDIGFAASTDLSGNLYIAGQAGAAMTAYNSDGTTFSPAIANAGSNDAFIVKYNTNGFVQWIARVASTAADIGYAIAADASGNVYITGQGGSNVVVTAFNADGTAFSPTLANAGNTDVFLVKYNTSGVVQWVTRIASASAESGRALATDSSGNIYVGCQGGLVVPYNSDGTTFTLSFPNTGTIDAYIVKYNTSGFVQWAITIAGIDTETVLGLAIDSVGNVYAAGRSGRGPILYNSDGTSIAPLANSAGYIAKYNSNGFAQWGVRFLNICSGIGVDAVGNVYSLGVYGTTTTSTTFTNSTGEVFAEVFGTGSVVKYDTNGIGQWVQVVRGTTLATTPQAISTDSFGNSYVTGSTASGESTFIYNLDFTPYKVLNSLGNTDVFIAKYSSTVTPQWITRITTLEVDIGYGIATDTSANVFVCGRGGDNVTLFYNADGTIFGTTLPRTAAGSTGYIAKYNTNGFVQWIARVITGTIAYQIATDISGNVYMVGNSATTAYNSDGTAFSPTLTNQAGDAFIVKYNTNGFVQWFTRIASGGSDTGFGVVADVNGNVFVTGQGGAGVVVTAFSAGNIAFSPTIANAGSSDAFIVKYNTSGVVQWVARVASTAQDIGYATDVDPAGNLYVTGQGGSAVTVTAYNFDGSAFSPALVTGGGNDAWVVKYSTIGAVQWVARIGGTGSEAGRAIAADSSGNVYVSGTYGATLTAYSVGDVAFSPTLPFAGASDVFVVKYNTNGVVQWNARISTFATDLVFDMVVDSAGSVYVSGSSSAYVVAYNADATLFGSAGHSITGSATGSFMVKYSSTGVVQWISTLNGTANDNGYGVALDSSNNIYLTGDFGSSALVPFDGV